MPTDERKMLNAIKALREVRRASGIKKLLSDQQRRQIQKTIDVLKSAIVLDKCLKS
jgi:hypothetical protein